MILAILLRFWPYIATACAALAIIFGLYLRGYHDAERNAAADAADTLTRAEEARRAADAAAAAAADPADELRRRGALRGE